MGKLTGDFGIAHDSTTNLNAFSALAAEYTEFKQAYDASAPAASR